MASHKYRLTLLVVGVVLLLTGCFHYSFTGTSIPPDVNTIFIPYFPDQSNSGQGNLSDRLYRALIQRFIEQSRLSLANSEGDADVVLDGSISSYTNRPFSVSGDQTATENRVQISVEATYKYTDKDEAEWTKTFSGYANYDPNENPIQGESDAADKALELVATNIFNDALGDW